MQMTKALVGGSGGKVPLKLNTYSFWMFNACFLIFGDAKNHSYMHSA